MVAPPLGVVEPVPGVVSGALSAGAGFVLGSGVVLGADGEEVGVVGVGVAAGAAGSSFLLHADKATANTEATIRVLLIISRLLFVGLWCIPWVLGETRIQATGNCQALGC
ncbi:hypothetical protein F783_017695 [Bordetella holmesii F627]|nr:hypothetical protein F783_017695 [Bordetella holmesii F627]